MKFRVTATWFVLLVPLCGIALVGASDARPAVRQLSFAPKVLAFTPPPAALPTVKESLPVAAIPSTATTAVVKETLTTQLEPARLELPAEVKGQPGEFVSIASKTNGVAVRWTCLDAGLNLFPVELLRDSKTAVVSGSKAGRFRVLAYTAVGGDASPPAICVVVIGDPGPAPGPGPGPDPKPLPEPTDLLWPAVKTAFTADALDAASAAKLAALYRQAKGDALAKAKTTGELIATLHGAAQAMVGDKLPKVRRALADELNSKIKVTESRAIDDALRAQYAEQFTRFATLLEACR